MKALTQTLCTISLAALLAAVSACAGMAADETYQAQDVDGEWVAIADGLWERHLATGAIQHRATSAEGVEWILRDIEMLGQELRAIYASDPSVHNLDQLRRHEEMEAATRSLLANYRAGYKPIVSAATASSCDVNFGVSARATILNTGIAARATAHYSSTCGLTGTVYGHALVRRNGVTRTETVGPRTGDNESLVANPPAHHGDGDCHGYARAYVVDHNGELLSETSSKDDCGVEPPDPCIRNPHLPICDDDFPPA